MGSDEADAVTRAAELASSPPYKLWRQAEAEHPDDEMARRSRYHELMVEHGHIVKAEPGQDRNLPCGWPGLYWGSAEWWASNPTLQERLAYAMETATELSGEEARSLLGWKAEVDAVLAAFPDGWAKLGGEWVRLVEFDVAAGDGETATCWARAEQQGGN